MAVVKHIASKSADYGAALDYLLLQHDELTGKVIRGADGQPLIRDEYLMDGLNCEPLEYPMAAAMTNAKWGKNSGRDEVKSHHYIVSFDPRDAACGLTLPEAHAMVAKLAREWFGGHEGIVFSHPEGHNGSGNVHVHIVINSVRMRDEPQREWMRKPSHWRAGGKHQVSRDFLRALKAAVMEMCQERGLHQQDLLPPAKERVTEREYWAQRRMDIGRKAEESAARKKAAKAHARPERSAADDDPYRTQKRILREAIRDARDRSESFEAFAAALRDGHGIEVEMKGSFISYSLPGRERPISGRALGLDYEWPAIERAIAARLRGDEVPKAPGLITQIESWIIDRGPGYSRAVRLANIKRISETVGYLKEAGLDDVADLDAAFEIAKEERNEAEAALKEIDESIRKVNEAIRARGKYYGNIDAVKGYQAAADKQGYYRRHRTQIEEARAGASKLRELYPDGKAPSMAELKAERERLVSEKNARYESYCNARYRCREVGRAKQNADWILGRTQRERARE